MPGRIALKRLAAVEIQPAASHQHELNAGTLRRELGFPEGRARGKLTILFCLADNAVPLIEDGEFTLYDAREAHPTRTEYRLYYDSSSMTRHGREGDLLVLFRPDASGPDLRALVVRAGTETERLLEKTLLRHGKEGLKRFLFVDAPLVDSSTATALVEPVLQQHTIGEFRKTLRYPVLEESIQRGSLPSTGAMAAAVHDMLGPGYSTPDAFIESALEAETSLYFAIERAIGTRKLNELSSTGPLAFDTVMSFAMSWIQSRRSRRGESLQNHFAKLLDLEHVPYTAQCRTERGETPDFIIPGRREYHDPAFPSHRLRMVGCKTIVRERWGQWLKEAARVRIKFALTLDPAISQELIARIHERLHFFIPAGILAQHYEGRPSRRLLGSVKQLVADLQAVV